MEKSILAAIAYFDIFNYPLTDVEIWKWLYCPANRFVARNSRSGLAEVQKILDDNQLIKSFVENRRGFYFFKNRGDLVDTRQTRYVSAEKKIKKAKRAARFLKLMPGVKMIALCNSLAWSNAREESDIDFFIVVARNKIWTARFFAAGFLQLLGLRPTKSQVKDTICLSFFVDEDSLNLEPLAIGQPDIYLMYWIAQMTPLYDRGGVYQKFWQANAWIKNFLPNVSQRDASVWEGKDIPAGRAGVVERFFCLIQTKLLSQKLKAMANRDSRVVVTDKILKFHANDRREEYKREWEERMAKWL